MNTIRILGALGVAAMLAGCAGSVSDPVAVQSMSSDMKASLKIADISADAEPGVPMSDGDFGLISQKVHAYIDAEKPGVIAEGSAAGQHMKIHFTRFDRGSAFARAMLIGMGQIRIEATVEMSDAGGARTGEYKVAKDFALGGIVGATTTVEDVEDGFAKSVAQVVK